MLAALSGFGATSRLHLPCPLLLDFVFISNSLYRYYQRKSRQFHEAKGKEEGVTTLDSGVQYKVLAKGEGETHPGATYAAKLIYSFTAPKFKNAFALKRFCARTSLKVNAPLLAPGCPSSDLLDHDCMSYSNI